MIRRLVAALALVAVGISMPVAPVPVHAARWADGPCTDNVGITIVVDFQELGGGVNVRCAPGPVTSGLDALDNAGIVWEGVRRFPSFVCRIAGQPGPASDACVNTPPATAYWTYWVAPRGGAWCYGSTGAGNRTPPPGTVEGWSFALGKVAVDLPPPRFDPPPPIPGEAPNPLRGGDCGSPAAGPPTPPAPTPPPTVAPPAPTTATATPAAPTTSAVPAEPDSAGTAVNSPQQQSAGGATATTSASLAATGAASASTTIAGFASTTSSGATTTTRPSSSSTSTSAVAGASSASTNTTGAVGDSVPLGTVDLGDDGRGDGGFSPAAGLGLLIAAGVGGTSIWAARRRRGTPP